jgi:hypothetical protein
MAAAYVVDMSAAVAEKRKKAGEGEEEKEGGRKKWRPGKLVLRSGRNLRVMKYGYVGTQYRDGEL